MRLKIDFIFLLLLMSPIFLWGQNWQLKDSIQISIRGEISDFEVDPFGNLYFISNHTTIYKLDTKTQQTKSYSNNQILEKLNTQNSLQITAKSGIFNLLVLDNQLNPVQDLVQFPTEYNFSPTLVALVDNNYLWGFDPILQRLILWNYQEKKIYSQSAILYDTEGDDFFYDLIYTNNQILLVGSQKIMLFDELANLKEVIPIPTYDLISFGKNNLIFAKENELFELNLTTKQTRKLDVNKRFSNFAFNHKFLFVMQDKVVYIYEYQN